MALLSCWLWIPHLPWIFSFTLLSFAVLMSLLSCWSWIPLLWRPFVGVFMNHRNGKVSFEDLPDDVIIDILSRLPADHVVRSRRVCKRWQGLMSTASFAELHLKKAQLVILSKHTYCVHIEEELKNKKRYRCVMRRKQLDDWTAACSCDGFLLLRNLHVHFIWNPITGEKVSLPVPRCRGAVSAFFFHPIRREYVVLFYATDLGNGWFEMLSLRTRSWRRLAGVAYGYPYSCPYTSFTPPPVVCGAMHWVLGTKNPSKLILRLNLQSEEFDTMPHPDEESFSEKEIFYLIEMEKRLTLCSVWGDSFDVWMLMDYEKWDWVKRYRISLKSDRPYDSYYETMVVARGCCVGGIGMLNGDLLLHWYGKGLYSCNLQMNKLRRIDVKGIERKYISGFEAHVNSIVSLQNLYSYRKGMEWKNFNFPLMPPEESFLQRIERLLYIPAELILKGMGSFFDGMDRLLQSPFVGEETITIIFF